MSDEQQLRYTVEVDREFRRSIATCNEGIALIVAKVETVLENQDRHARITLEANAVMEKRFTRNERRIAHLEKIGYGILAIVAVLGFMIGKIAPVLEILRKLK